MDPEDAGATWRAEATYLVAETAHGLCLVDILLDWDAIRDDIMDDKFQFIWSAVNGPAPQLTVLTQQLINSDAGFLEHESCFTNEYGVAHVHFTPKQKSADLDHRCFPEHSPGDAP